MSLQSTSDCLTTKQNSDGETFQPHSVSCSWGRVWAFSDFTLRWCSQVWQDKCILRTRSNVLQSPMTSPPKQNTKKIVNLPLKPLFDWKIKYIGFILLVAREGNLFALKKLHKKNVSFSKRVQSWMLDHHGSWVCSRLAASLNIGGSEVERVYTLQGTNISHLGKKSSTQKCLEEGICMDSSWFPGGYFVLNTCYWNVGEVKEDNTLKSQIPLAADT